MTSPLKIIQCCQNVKRNMNFLLDSSHNAVHNGRVAVGSPLHALFEEAKQKPPLRAAGIRGSLRPWIGRSEFREVENP